MNKIEEALDILKQLGLPREQHNERSAICLLALLDLSEDDSWENGKELLIGITPMMEFAKEKYKKEYAPNTRETFRRQTIHQFVDASIALINPDLPDRSTNSPKTVYQIEQETANLIKYYGTPKWKESLAAYRNNHISLAEKYAKQRKMRTVQVVTQDGKEFSFSPGKHSELIRDIIVEFAPRFCPGANLVYVGDTGKKFACYDKQKLNHLGVFIEEHGKMPDVILYYENKNWLLLIEAVTSHGPVDSKRHDELTKLFNGAKSEIVYITAFPTRRMMAKYLSVISWETEVWIAENPEHLIHFNGDKFLGPYTNS